MAKSPTDLAVEACPVSPSLTSTRPGPQPHGEPSGRQALGTPHCLEWARSPSAEHPPPSVHPWLSGVIVLTWSVSVLHA